MSHHLQMIVMLVVTIGILFFLVKVWFSEKNAPEVAKITDEENAELSSFQQLVELEEEPDTISKNIKHTEKKSVPEIMSINVIAKAGETFASYDLFQAISSTGMQFGAMNIFHYYDDPLHDSKKVLFSLASMTEPGEFDMNHIGEFSSPGLCLFMDLQAVKNIEEVFGRMLATAEQLADDLEGELFADPKTPWNTDILNHYHKKIAEYA